MICPNSNRMCERGECHYGECRILRIQKQDSLIKINNQLKHYTMDFNNDAIAVKVVTQLKELKINGVNLAGGSEYNRVFEAFYKLFKDADKLQRAAKSVLSETMYFEVGEEGEHFEDTETYKKLEHLVNDYQMPEVIGKDDSEN